tara:strand:- start:485 stop:622 length:138 start_codon:yes stop_codon:yes gene_type:complete
MSDSKKKALSQLIIVMEDMEGKQRKNRLKKKDDKDNDKEKEMPCD